MGPFSAWPNVVVISKELGLDKRPTSSQLHLLLSPAGASKMPEEEEEEEDEEGEKKKEGKKEIRKGKEADEDAALLTNEQTRKKAPFKR